MDNENEQPKKAEVATGKKRKIAIVEHVEEQVPKPAKPEVIEPTSKKIAVLHDTSDEKESVAEPDIEDEQDEDLVVVEDEQDEVEESAEDEIIDEYDEDETTEAEEIAGDYAADDVAVNPEPEIASATVEDAIAAAETQQKPATTLNDTELDQAVDEIVNEDSDKLLEAEDEALREQVEPEKPKNNKKPAFLKRFFGGWWRHTKLRWATLIGLFLLLVAAAFVPVSRYAILNLAGVRVRASVVVVDSKTGLPLKNIPVEIQGKKENSNSDGYVAFGDLKQGKTMLKIERIGYATIERKLTLGWGSNPIGEQPVVATGAQFNFVLKDWKSEQPIKNGEASSGEDVAKIDEEGRVVITVGAATDQTEITLSADGYRSEVLTVAELESGEKTVLMVPSKPHIFVSNRDGQYDVYKIDVDGKNEELLVEATKKEREVPFVLPHQSRDIVAFVSSRDGDVNKDNFVLDGLFTLDAGNGELYKITRSEQLQVVGWWGNKLVYVAVVEGASAGNSQRSKLVAYDLETKERTDIAASNYFNDVKLIDGVVYYAISSYAVPQSQAKLFAYDIESATSQTVVDAQVWSIIRESYDTLLFSAVDRVWYEMKNDEQARKLDSQPANQQNRNYQTSPDKTHSVRVEVRDGKGTLLLYDIQKNEETAVTASAGIADPVYWANDKTLVYRVETSDESADYVVNIEGGEPQKIADVIGNRSRYFY